MPYYVRRGLDPITGKLLPGFRYSGKRLKSGKAQIVRTKPKKKVVGGLKIEKASGEDRNVTIQEVKNPQRMMAEMIARCILREITWIQEKWKEWVKKTRNKTQRTEEAFLQMFRAALTQGMLPPPLSAMFTQGTLEHFLWKKLATLKKRRGGSESKLEQSVCQTLKTTLNTCWKAGAVVITGFFVVVLRQSITNVANATNNLANVAEDLRLVCGNELLSETNDALVVWDEGKSSRMSSSSIVNMAEELLNGLPKCAERLTDELRNDLRENQMVENACPDPSMRRGVIEYNLMGIRTLLKSRELNNSNVGMLQGLSIVSNMFLEQSTQTPNLQDLPTKRGSVVALPAPPRNTIYEQTNDFIANLVDIASSYAKKADVVITNVLPFTPALSKLSVNDTLDVCHRRVNTEMKRRVEDAIEKYITNVYKNIKTIGNAPRDLCIISSAYLSALGVLSWVTYKCGQCAEGAGDCVFQRTKKTRNKRKKK